MGKPSKPAAALGLLFLSVGALWLSAIFIRCDGYLLWKKMLAQTQQHGSDPQEGKDLTGSLAGSLTKNPTQELRDLPIKKFLSKTFIALFWAIAYLESTCALFYLLSGISLLRVYPFGRRFAVFTLAADAVLKAMVVTYQQQAILPLKDVFRETNVLLAHFAPDGSFMAQVSAYLTGVRLIQPGAVYYAAAYAILWGGFLCIFLHPKSKKLF